jgi:hypothetical protein
VSKILLNKTVVFSVLASIFSFNVNAGGKDDLNNLAPQAPKATAPLAPPTINGSVRLGVYNPALNTIMSAMQTSGYTPTAVDSSALTESQRNGAIYFMNPPRGN